MLTAENKPLLLAEIRKHRKADEIVAGVYAETSDGVWHGGCAIGCAVESWNTITGAEIDHNDHAAIAEALGVPAAVMYLVDAIFEGLEGQAQLNWPERVVDAITPGADYRWVAVDFRIALMGRLLRRLDKDEWGVADAIRGVRDVLKDWRKTGVRDASGADAAAWAADTAARAADIAAEDAEAAKAAWAAVSAAWAAARDAEAGAWYTWAADAAEWRWMADKLIELMRKVNPS